MTELKPCPFCGSDNIEASPQGVAKWYYAHCNDCGADGPPDLGISGSAERWNTRPEEDRLRALVALQGKDGTE